MTRSMPRSGGSLQGQWRQPALERREGRGRGVSPRQTQLRVRHAKRRVAQFGTIAEDLHAAHEAAEGCFARLSLLWQRCSLAACLSAVAASSLRAASAAWSACAGRDQPFERAPLGPARASGVERARAGGGRAEAWRNWRRSATCSCRGEAAADVRLPGGAPAADSDAQAPAADSPAPSGRDSAGRALREQALPPARRQQPVKRRCHASAA